MKIDTVSLGNVCEDIIKISDIFYKRALENIEYTRDKNKPYYNVHIYYRIKHINWILPDENTFIWISRYTDYENVNTELYNAIVDVVSDKLISSDLSWTLREFLKDNNL